MNNEKKPLVSVIMLSYNHDKYINSALNSILSQNYSNMEIIISDDNSTDRTFEIIEETVGNYNGPHKIKINKNPQNLGLIRHFNMLLSWANGEIIIVAAGDDVSFPYRVKKSVDAMVNNNTISFLSFNDRIIDEHGNRLGKINKVKKETQVNLIDFLKGKNLGFSFSGASRAFRKEVFTKFGDLNNECPTEDTPYLLRCLYLGDGLVLPEDGIEYRIHSASLSSPENIDRMPVKFIERQYMKDLSTALDLSRVSKNDAMYVKLWMFYMRAVRCFYSKGWSVKKLLIVFLLSVNPVFYTRCRKRLVKKNCD